MYIYIVVYIGYAPHLYTLCKVFVHYIEVVSYRACTCVYCQFALRM